MDQKLVKLVRQHTKNWNLVKIKICFGKWFNWIGKVENIFFKWLVKSRSMLRNVKMRFLVEKLNKIKKK